MNVSIMSIACLFVAIVGKSINCGFDVKKLITDWLSFCESPIFKFFQFNCCNCALCQFWETKSNAILLLFFPKPSQTSLPKLP